MFPDFRYLIHGLTGAWPPEWMALFKTFGLMVALAFIAASMVLIRELKRKEKAGLMQPTIHTVEEGKPATSSEILLSALGGFILGFKVGGFFGHWQEIAPDPASYLFSAQGNLLAGLAVGVLLGYLKYSGRKKAALPRPVQKKIATWPHQRIGEVVLIAAVAGIIGAKIFNALETWDQFIADPIGSLTSSSGLTFYGGFLAATAVFYFFAKKHKIRFAHLADAAGPAILLAYGIGRLGCQLSGDGDWGIFNSAYVTQADGTLTEAPRGEVISFLQGTGAPHAYVPAPGWLPRSFVAQHYPHNVINEGVRLQDCTGEYCSVLPVAVFPTPLYETVACVLLFLLLWSIRRKLKKPWQMFALFLIATGVERFFVELIRVNTTYDLGFIQPTQAEIISTLLVLTGVILFWRSSKAPLPATADAPMP